MLIQKQVFDRGDSSGAKGRALTLRDEILMEIDKLQKPKRKKECV